MKHLVYFFCLLVSLSWGENLSAQAQTFKFLYGTSGNDDARDVLVLPDNSMLVVGSVSTGGSSSGASVVKISPNGALVWSRVFGGQGKAFFSFIMSCSDGHFLALGESKSAVNDVNIFVVKFDAQGNSLWQRSLGGANTETGYGACEISDGYIVSGGTRGSAFGAWDIFIEKLSKNGTSEWKTNCGGSGGDIAGVPLHIGNDEVWVSGFVRIYDDEHDPFLMKINGKGERLNFIRYKSFGNDNHYSLVKAGEGMFGAGSSWVHGNGSKLEPWAMRFNKTGNLVWAKFYPLPDGHHEATIAACSDGGAILVPRSYFGDAASAYLIRIDAQGEVFWAKNFEFGEGAVGRIFNAKPTPDGGFVVVGYAVHSSKGSEMLVIKTDEAGRTVFCCPTDVPVTAQAANPVISPFSVGYGFLGINPSNNPPNNSNPIAGMGLTDVCQGPRCLTLTGELNTLKAEIFPNPAVNSIAVCLPDDPEVAHIEVYSQEGQLVISQAMTSCQALDVSLLSKGLFHLTAYLKNGQIATGIFIKQ